MQHRIPSSRAERSNHYMKAPPRQESRCKAFASTECPTARLLWLALDGEQSQRGQILRNMLAGVDMAVTVWGQSVQPSEAWLQFDLILLQVANQSLGQVHRLLTQIRAQSWAPVILLTERQVLEWSLTTLPAGADAVIGLHTADEVIVARCQALLRRWSPTG